MAKHPNDIPQDDTTRRPEEIRRGNEDYDDEIRYGRSGMVRPVENRDTNPAYRGDGVHDEDDFDSDYGNTSDYDDKTFDPDKKPNR